MSDTFDHSGLPEDELLAAEYALGALDGIDRATAEQRIAHDRNFARQVAAWEQRLAPWAAEIPEMLPARHVWDRIAGALPPQTSRPGLWRNLAFWRGLSFAAGALAAVCIAALVYFGTFAQTEPLVATIEGGGQRHVVATIDVKRGTVAIVPNARARALADPARWQAEAGRPAARRCAGHADALRRSRRSGKKQCGIGGFA